MEVIAQGTQVPCGNTRCNSIIHIPDTYIGKELQEVQLDSSTVEKEFESLLEAAESKNRLYYLLALLGAETDHTRLVDFIVSINMMTSECMSTKRNSDSSPYLAPHETLFLFQSHLESKAYYAVWRNFLNIILGRRFHPSPWDAKRNDYLVKKQSSNLVQFNTKSILDNMAKDLQLAGFPTLATEFKHTHAGLGLIIRNATAHATIQFPSETNGRSWVFGDFYQNPQGGISLRRHVVPHYYLERYIKRFFIFRFASNKAFSDKSNEARSTKEHFQSPNQSNPQEIVDCWLENGQLRISGIKSGLW